MTNIIQIIEAKGWKAMHAVKREFGNRQEPFELTDLVCWALIEEIMEEGEPYRYVKGMTSSDIPSWIEDTTINNNFIAYIGPNDHVNEFRQACIDYNNSKKEGVTV